MKYLIIALINIIYGILLIVFTPPVTPGFITVLIISGTLIILGGIGLFYWIRKSFFNDDESSNEAVNQEGLKNWWGLIRGFDILLILGLLFKIFVIQPFIVDGASMEKNFHNNEMILVNKISYNFNAPKRGDVIIFKAPQRPEDDYIKRVIGLPGETVKISEGKIYINNRLLDEYYLGSRVQTETYDNQNTYFSQTLGTDEYFVLGDNRGNSSDSREWGVLPKKNIIGKAWLVILPFDSKGLIKNPEPVLQ